MSPFEKLKEIRFFYNPPPTFIDITVVVVVVCAKTWPKNFYLAGLVVMILMTLMDLSNNYVTTPLFTFCFCIINIMLWRFINQARAGDKDRDVEEEGNVWVSAVTEEPL